MPKARTIAVTGATGRLGRADDPRYDDARRVVFTGFDSRPAAIVRAGDASDVARVVTLARETGAELPAVYSGISAADQPRATSRRHRASTSIT